MLKLRAPLASAPPYTEPSLDRCGREAAPEVELVGGRGRSTPVNSAPVTEWLLCICRVPGRPFHRRFTYAATWSMSPWLPNSVTREHSDANSERSQRRPSSSSGPKTNLSCLMDTARFEPAEGRICRRLTRTVHAGQSCRVKESTAHR